VLVTEFMVAIHHTQKTQIKNT